eukprot:c9585_g1_i1.p1 GENE.c9585_g1_i1~~c9585_g1_i1.p1  ORF type:complete len:266 (-),score=62.37 c9585_g1_i1:129-926(-)
MGSVFTTLQHKKANKQAKNMLVKSNVVVFGTAAFLTGIAVALFGHKLLASKRHRRTRRHKIISCEQKEKRARGELYEAFHPVIARELADAHELCFEYNSVVRPTDMVGRMEIVRELLGSYDRDLPPYLEPPFYCDFGYNIRLGKNFYCNFGCVMLDTNTVTIGDSVMFAPNVHLYTATHPHDAATRDFVPYGQGKEIALPIVIGDSVWVGGGAIICPGVTIGSNVIVGAGAVVVRDVPSNCIVAGVPARVVKILPPITQRTTQLV